MPSNGPPNGPDGPPNDPDGPEGPPNGPEGPSNGPNGGVGDHQNYQKMASLFCSEHSKWDFWGGQKCTS